MNHISLVPKKESVMVMDGATYVAFVLYTPGIMVLSGIL